jgi:putative Holliday junction resolvase
MGRIMGVDWGQRRIGIALSDESRTIASPHTVLHRSGSLDRELDHVVTVSGENDVCLIVFGLPVRLDGSAGPEAKGVLEVIEKLGEKTQIPVKTWDERLSTTAAERALLEGNVSRKKRRGIIDQVAAALILQSYLDSESGRS